MIDPELAQSGISLPERSGESKSPLVGLEHLIGIENSSSQIPPSPALSRSWSQRTFSKIGAGSVRGSIFSLCCSAIGMGVLVMPYMMAQVGIIGAYVLLFIGGYAGYTSLRICCAGMHATKTHSYVETLIALFSPGFAAVLTSMLVIAVFGMCSGYFVFSSQLIQQLLLVSGAPAFICHRHVIITVCACFPVFPLSLNRHLSDFRYLTLISISGLAYLTVLVMVRTPRYLDTNAQAAQPISWWLQLHDPGAIPKCLSLCFAAYTVHMNVFATYDELQNPTPSRITKVLLRSTWVQSTLYVLIALCGFLSFGADTQDNVLMGFGERDVLANIGRIFVSFQLLLAVPLSVHPGRIYLWPLLVMTYSACCKKRALRSIDSSNGLPDASSQGEELRTLLIETGAGANMPRGAHITLSTGFVVLTALVAAKVRSASDLLGVVGGFACVTYAFLLPAQIAWRLRNNTTLDIDWESSPAPFVRNRVRGMLSIIGLVTCSVLGYIAAVQCAIRLVKEGPSST